MGAALLVGKPSGIGKTLGRNQSVSVCRYLGPKGCYEPMLVCPHMRGVTSLRHNSSFWPHSTISIQLMATVSFVIGLALAALEARV
jgi:hypothetical protein